MQGKLEKPVSGTSHAVLQSLDQVWRQMHDYNSCSLPNVFDPGALIQNQRERRRYPCSSSLLRLSFKILPTRASFPGLPLPSDLTNDIASNKCQSWCDIRAFSYKILGIRLTVLSIHGMIGKYKKTLGYVSFCCVKTYIPYFHQGSRNGKIVHLWRAHQYF